MDKNTPSTYIDIRHYIRTCWRNLGFFFLVIVLFIGGACIYQKMEHEIQREYDTTFTFSVIPESATTEHGRLSDYDVSAAEDLGTSYCEIFTQSRIVEQIKAVSGIDPSAKVKVDSYNTESAIVYGFRVTADSPSAVSKFTETFIACMQNGEYGQIPGSRIILSEEPFYSATANDSTSGMSIKKLAVLAALLAVIVAAAFVFFRTVSKNYVTRPELLEKQTGLKVIGNKTIPVEKV